MKILSLVLLLLMVLPSWGNDGFSKGNGGYGVFCSADKTWRMLDQVEAEVLFKMPMDLDLLAKDDKFLVTVKERMATVAPVLAKTFSEISAKWSQEVTWIKSAQLGPIYDVFPSVLPVGCELKLAAFQRADRYFVSLPIWEAMSVEQQRILMLHEMIYRSILSQKKLDDSRPVRAMVALILSQDFEKMDREEIQKFKLMNNLKFQ